MYGLAREYDHYGEDLLRRRAPTHLEHLLLDRLHAAFQTVDGGLPLQVKH